MSVWSIADLHLSFAHPDRRERFAERWRDHAAKIEREWRAVVKRDDLVLLPGDLSMARTHRDLQPDLEWLDRLPGTKVLSAGNHDRWWNGVDKIRPMLRRTLLAVGGDAIITHGVIVCGTLGAPVLPEEPTADQVAAGDRELLALESALETARTLRTNDESIYVLWHYPPFDQHRRPGPCVARFEAAGVRACVYGHLHIQGQWALAPQGTLGRVRYFCVAADAVGFRPLRVDL
jgi:predicted phosphohydrolase